MPRTPAWPDLKQFARTAAAPVLERLPAPMRKTLALRALGLARIPLVFYVSPTVVELTEERGELRIPLNWRTRNHVGSMYFGALAIGADLAGGMMAMDLIQREFPDLVFLFKDFQAEFLKRAEGDVHFSCEQGREIRELLEKASASGERENLPFDVVATVPSKTGAEPIGRFRLTLSVKRGRSRTAEKTD
jgi:acyl-coenzyme A thioesterase PaaI-like protein